ncbi:MAG TPA: MMPL family transporter [Gammaproteobacteria bacterium]|nr:MMPL family transporter [Gammaproteobacteria bacterium]
MTEEPLRPSRLEHVQHPVAIVHEGFFVYANALFLQRLGYRSFDDLQAVPLLDMVDERYHDRLREHLDAAKKSAGTEQRHPQTKLSLHRADDLPLSASCTSFRTRFGGEDCVQLNLTTAEDASLLGRIGALPWRHYLSLLFLLLFTVLPSSLLLKLNINNAPDVYFPDDEPAVVLDRELRTRFPNDQVFVLLFEGVALFSDGFLGAYDDLRRSLEKLDAIDEVVAVTTQDHIAGTQDDFIVEPLIDVRTLEQSRPADRQKRVLEDELNKGVMASADGSALAMVVIPKKSGNSIERLALEEQILAAVKDARLRGYLVAMAGQIPLDVAQLRSMLRDNMIFIPATVATGLALIWWLFRRWLAVMLAGVAIGVVTNSTVAIYVLLDQPFTLVSSIIPPLLSALTVAALVHLFNGLFIASKLGYSGAERVARAIQEVDRPALFAALTTAGGLASLATSPIVPIKTFGLISALGTLLIYLVVFRILPNIVVRWDKRPWTNVRGSAHLVDRIVSMLYRFGIRQPALVIGTVCVLLALGAPQLRNVLVETNLQEFFDFNHPVRQQTRDIEDKLVGTMAVSVIFDADARDGLKDPQKLRLIRDFQQWAKAQPEIDRSFGLPDFVQEMHWAFNAENPAFRQLPDDRELITQYLLIYDGEDIYDFVDRDFQHSQIALNLNVHSANDISRVLENIRGYLRENVGDALRWEIAGNGRLFADMEDLLVSGQVYSLWGALVLIFVFMLFFLRSFWAAVLCMIPNLSPIFLIFVIMGLTGIWLDMATAMIASVAIGIAVDDTIHVFHGFKRRVAGGVSPVVALARAYRGAGRAVVTTTIILSAQFLILVWSDFVPTRNFGLLTTVGLISALAFDLLLLPALLIVFYGPASPVAAWVGRLSRSRTSAADDSATAPQAVVDAAYWTTERKLTLVREILSGKSTVAAAAREYELPEAMVQHWHSAAETALADALDDDSAVADTDQGKDKDKLRKLARAYKRLQAENRELQVRRHD